MKPYTTEVEFLRDEVEKCHESMHSQVETLKLLMEAHLELKKKVERPWVGLTITDMAELRQGGWHNISDERFRVIEAKLKEKNT